MERTLYLNGTFHTLDPKMPQAEAIVVEAGRIIAIGSKEEISLQFERPDVRKIDLQGGHVYPGFVDNHMHLTSFGMKRSMLDFTEVRSKEELLHILRKQVAKTDKDEWIIGLNWNENQFPDKAIPTLEEIDEIAPNHPVFLIRTCYHTYLVNSVAFQRAGVTEGRRDPDGGSFGRKADGRFNGLVYDQASLIFREAQPKPTYSDLKEYVRKGMEYALSTGLTAVHTDDLREIGNVRNLIQIYRELREEGFYLRSHHLIYHPYLEELDGLHTDLGEFALDKGATDSFGKGAKYGPGPEFDIGPVYEAGSVYDAGSGNPWFRIGACKIFADGAIGGRTALLSQPYADAPDTHGLAIHSLEELLELTRKARNRHMPIAVHAIGDQAAEMVITAMETYPVGTYVKNRLKDRLIHAQVMRKDLIERLKKLDVAVDIQPRFVASDFPWVMERLGPERLDYAYAWKTLLNAGLKCGAGSDAPIEPIEPLLGIHAAITRRNPQDVDHPGYIPQEKLTAMEAITLFTMGTTYATGEEGERGSISIGKFADLTVYDRDLEKCEPDELLGAKTLYTIVNGKVGYRGF